MTQGRCSSSSRMWAVGEPAADERPECGAGRAAAAAAPGKPGARLKLTLAVAQYWRL